MAFDPGVSVNSAILKAPGAKSIEPSPFPSDFTLLQITPALEAGGVEQATLDMARAVARRGWTSLVASHGGRLEPDLARTGARLVRLPVHARDPVSLALNAVRLTRLIQERRVSLIHVRSRAPAFSALLAARATGAPLVATYHGIYAARSPLKRWYNGVMTRGDLVIANSLYTRDHIVSQHGVHPDRLALAPEGIDTEAFDPARVAPDRVAAVRAGWGLAADDRRSVVLMAARPTAWKGHRIIVEAFRRAVRADAVLVLTGLAEHPAFAAVLGADGDRVRVVGAGADMPAAFLAADLVAAPSIQAESFGRTVVEAAAMGRPVLASALGAHTETVVHGETGWLAPPGDIAAWSVALDQALATPVENRARLGRAARERAVRLYSLPTMVAATLEAYRRVLEARA